jgi:hypothetical protein
MVVLYLDVSDFGWLNKEKILIGDVRSEALLCPGKVFQVG